MMLTIGIVGAVISSLMLGFAVGWHIGFESCSKIDKGG